MMTEPSIQENNDITPNTEKTAKLPMGKRISYSLGNIGGLAIGQAGILLLYTYYYFYIKVPIPPLWLSMLLAINAIWNGLAQPLVGYISDNLHSHLGRRKPLIIAGLVPMVVFAVLIYTPPLGDPVLSGVYLLVTLCAYDLFVTMVISCWSALFPELSLDQSVRLSVSNFLQIFGIIGLIIGLGVAPVIAGLFNSYAVGYPVMGMVLGTICAVFMLPTVFKIKEHPEYQVKEEEKIGFVHSFGIALRNKSFLYYVLVQLLLQVSYALVVSSLPLFYSGILGLGSLQYAPLLLATFATVLPFLFVWVKLAGKRGTKQALFVSMICFCAAFPFAYFINSYLVALFVMLAGGVGLGGLMLFPTIMLSDVVDEDQLKTGLRREGVFSGVSGVIVKASNAISYAVIGIVLTLFQVDQNNLNPAALTALSALGLRLLIAFFPVIILIFGILSLRRYPLAGEKLAEIKRQVEELNKSVEDANLDEAKRVNEHGGKLKE